MKPEDLRAFNRLPEPVRKMAEYIVGCPSESAFKYIELLDDLRCGKRFEPEREEG